MSAHDGKQYVCEVCEREFGGKNALTVHQRIHFLEKSHVCNICQRAFFYRRLMLRHMQVHSNEKAYPCELSELRDIRLPPPAHSGQGRRRRSSVASSQAALAGSGLAYPGGSTGSRCHSALGHYGLEPELWLTRRMSLTHSELLNEVNLSPTSSNPRQRWSEAGRSFGETTIRASVRQFRTASDFLVPGSRQPSSRRMPSEEPSEDLMDMSFTDSLMDSSVPSYERIPRKDKKRRGSKAGYHCYDNPSSLKEYGGT